MGAVQSPQETRQGARQMTDQLMDDLTNEEHEALLLMSDYTGPLFRAVSPPAPTPEWTSP